MHIGIKNPSAIGTDEDDSANATKKETKNAIQNCIAPNNAEPTPDCALEAPIANAIAFADINDTKPIANHKVTISNNKDVVNDAKSSATDITS